MKSQKLLELIREGESLTVEFKECKNKLNKDVFETVCSFLNRNGGSLILGIRDDGTLIGVDLEHVDQIKKDFVTSLNNPLTINPTFYLSVEEIDVDGKTILYINIPESSQVHRCKGKIFDRNEDGDFDITNNTNLVSGLYMRKQSTYTENRIFPYAEMNELEEELFTRVRKTVANMRPDHPWTLMDNVDILKSAGMYLKDQSTGKQGITLAGILIFGSELMIQTTLPHFRTDAILRMIIEKDRVYIENGNKPHGNGIIDPEDFSPYPKNPKIAKFFKEIGWVDELGSGVRNMFKYNKIYSGADPEFIEGDVFKTIIPLVEQASEQVGDNLSSEERINKLLAYCKIPRSRQEMQDYLDIKDREYFRIEILTPLIDSGLVIQTIPEKPTSPNQKYYSIEQK